ncbi:amino acid adenylation domain-containing protein [Streptomyces avermitilis]|uniref:amino acid adenylation domain-containing protein n=1 Tax=Streptomyces avermitilis TaxID=33903 RepID=UPI0033F4F02B
MSTLADQLARTAATRPAAEAVRLRDTSIDYAELDRASGALALTLSEAGLRPGDRAAVWLDKSIEAIIAVHAILKAGAAYVPVDPMAPPVRVGYMLADCAATCLITDADRLGLFHEDGVNGLSGLKGGVVVGEPYGPPAAGPAPGTQWTSWDKAVDRTVTPAAGSADVAPTDLAYVLYTSGSTGVPKGVMLSHRNAISFVDWAATEFGVGPEDRIASHAPLHFDLSVFDVFAAARTGACLVLIPESRRASGAALNRLVAEERITVWYSVPGALVRMLDAKNHHLLRSSALRTVLFAGEVFPVKHLRRLREALPGAQLGNLYGPTETNVCTFHRVTDEDLAPERTAPPPIGQPCPYASAHLIDAEGRPIPLAPGAEGELCIGGDSVMLGYWGAPAGPGPAATAPVHRTGDIVRFDGERGYVFLGRRDHMVKVRGYRIELEDVEAALLTSAAVHEAACVVAGAGDDEARLEAYIVPADGVHSSPGELRRHCLDALPRYMVPADFHLVDALPRTSTGKTDRRALAAAADAGKGVPCPPES